MQARRGAVAPLALPAAPHASAFEARFENDAVDALPYVDVLPEGWRDAAEALVREEMRRSDATVDDYVAKLPPAAQLTFKNCPLVAADVARAASGAPLPPPDASRYRLEAPSGAAASDAAAWAAALSNAQAQLEHQALRVQNLELLAKYGAAAWLAHTRGLEAAVAAAQRDLDALDAAAAQLHKTRKVQQTAAGAELATLERQWRAAVAKNAEIAAACDELEARAAAAGGAGAGEAMAE